MHTGSIDPGQYIQSGQRTHPLYDTWANMKRRCYEIHNKSFPYYGGRGITVCDRWLGPLGFKNFLEDMGERPNDHTLERVDVNGNYSPDNCVWATVKQQMNNRRSNKFVTWDGKRYSVAALVEHLGLPNNTLIYYQRLARGWTVEDTFKQR